MKKKKGNTPQFALRQDLFSVTGTDLTQVDGIDVVTAMTVLSELCEKPRRKPEVKRLSYQLLVGSESRASLAGRTTNIG